MQEEILSIIQDLDDLTTGCEQDMWHAIVRIKDIVSQPQEKTMTNLNELALEYYQKNVDLIKRESDWGNDKDNHEQALEWTVDDLAGDIHELLEEAYEEQKGV